MQDYCWACLTRIYKWLKTRNVLNLLAVQVKARLHTTFGFFCATNLQKLLYALSETWNFSVSMNISTHIYNLYLYIRTLLFLSCEIRNFHLLAIPIFSFHNGEEIYSHAEKAMYVIFPNWKYIIVSISIDGKINMTNRVKGVATIFKNIKPGLFCLWCGLHQLEPFLKPFFKKLMDTELYSLLTGLILYLRM